MTASLAPAWATTRLGVAAMLTVARILDVAGADRRRVMYCSSRTRAKRGLGNLRGMRASGGERTATVIGTVVAVEGHNLGARDAPRRGQPPLPHAALRGPGGHSWGNYGRPNAIHILAELIADLAALPVPREPKTSLSVGTIEGGVSVNTIPPVASALVDVRSVSQAQLERLAGQLEKTVRAVRIADVQAAAEILGDRPAGEIPADTPIVRICADALRALGIAPVLDASSTDANVPIGLGIPAVCVGVAEGGNAHRREEFIRIPTIPTGVQQLLLITLALAGHEG